MRGEQLRRARDAAARIEIVFDEADDWRVALRCPVRPRARSPESTARQRSTSTMPRTGTACARQIRQREQRVADAAQTHTDRHDRRHTTISRRRSSAFRCALIGTAAPPAPSTIAGPATAPMPRGQDARASSGAAFSASAADHGSAARRKRANSSAAQPASSAASNASPGDARREPGLDRFHDRRAFAARDERRGERGRDARLADVGVRARDEEPHHSAATKAARDRRWRAIRGRPATARRCLLRHDRSRTRDAQARRTRRDRRRANRRRVDSALREAARENQRRCFASQHDGHDRSFFAAHVEAEFAQFAAHAVRRARANARATLRLPALARWSTHDSAAAAIAGGSAVSKMNERAVLVSKSMTSAGPATKPPAAPSAFDSVPTITIRRIAKDRAHGRCRRARRCRARALHR